MKETQKRPIWITVVAILGIVFGCFGILGGSQEILMPQMIKFQKEMMATMAEKFRQHENENSAAETSKNQTQFRFPFQMFEAFDQMLNYPPWFEVWFVCFGIAKLLISAFYLLASIWLLQLKTYSIPCFYWAAGLSIVLGIIKGIVLLSGLSLLGMAMMFGGVFGIVIDIVLIIVVATGEHDLFYSSKKNEILS